MAAQPATFPLLRRIGLVLFGGCLVAGGVPLGFVLVERSSVSRAEGGGGRPSDPRPEDAALREELQKLRHEVRDLRAEVANGRRSIEVLDVPMAFAPENRRELAQVWWDDQNGVGWADANVVFCTPKAGTDGILYLDVNKSIKYLTDRGKAGVAVVRGAWYVPERGVIDSTWAYFRFGVQGTDTIVGVVAHPNDRDSAVSIGHLLILVEREPKR